jgi:hypothetical protein
MITIGINAIENYLIFYWFFKQMLYTKTLLLLFETIFQLLPPLYQHSTSLLGEHGPNRTGDLKPLYHRRAANAAALVASYLAVRPGE